MAGNYRGEMLGMVVVCVFLLVVESFCGSQAEIKNGNKVTCDNKGSLHTFDKKSKRIASRSSTVDVGRALPGIN